jgi:hypothetical protein
MVCSGLFCWLWRQTGRGLRRLNGCRWRPQVAFINQPITGRTIGREETWRERLVGSTARFDWGLNFGLLAGGFKSWAIDISKQRFPIYLPWLTHILNIELSWVNSLLYSKLSLFAPEFIDFNPPVKQRVTPGVRGRPKECDLLHLGLQCME